MNTIYTYSAPKVLKNKKNAFTLIELLVVIAIIGVLASVVLSSLNSARGRARDAQRVANVRNFKSALELYYNDNGSYPFPSTGVNPVSNSGFLGSGSGVGSCGGDGNPFEGTGLVSLLSPYIDISDQSPMGKDAWPYCWYYKTNSINISSYCPSSPTNAGYFLIFATEKAQYQIGKTSTSNPGNSAKRYCVTNLD